MANTQVDPSLNALTEKIEALESRNAFQDDVIEQLNHELAIHQTELADIKLQLKVVVERLKDSANNNSGKAEVEPPPPHY